MAKKINKVVLAYSGGLDTSIILKWLQTTYGCEVVTFTADLGQGERSEEHTSELQSRLHLVCRLLLEKKKIRSTRQCSLPLTGRSTAWTRSNTRVGTT